MCKGLVGVVVVTYNRLLLLKEVIESIRRQDYSNYHIIVVNNGSTDGTLEWLNKQKDVITITQSNLGGAGGFYTGMKYVAERQYDFCWVMDDDVVTTPTALSELLAAYHRSDDIGYVCSRVSGIDGQPMNTPSVDNRACNGQYPHYYDLIDHKMIRVINATFVSVLFPISVIRELGLPYKEYFIWGDDSEYTERIARKHLCYLACDSVVIHKRTNQGMLDFNSESNRQRLGNYFYYYRNNGYNMFIRQGYNNKRGIVLNYLRTSLHYVSRLDFVRAKIIFSAAVSLVRFSPSVVYPRFVNME